MRRVGREKDGVSIGKEAVLALRKKYLKLRRYASTGQEPDEGEQLR